MGCEVLAVSSAQAALAAFFADLKEGWMSPILMRVPFLLATSLFYGYIVLPERTGQMTPLTVGPARMSAAKARMQA
jgi:hypothetical protein